MPRVCTFSWPRLFVQVIMTVCLLQAYYTWLPVRMYEAQLELSGPGLANVFTSAPVRFRLLTSPAIGCQLAARADNPSLLLNDLADHGTGVDNITPQSLRRPSHCSSK